MNVNKFKKIMYYVKGIGITYAIYGIKYRFQDTTTDYSRLKYGKEKFLRKHLKKIIKKYKKNSNDIKLNNNNKEHMEKFPIWFCWFQGLENAPEVVKCCYQSIKENINNKKQEIHLITLDNIKDYVQIPKHIQEKFEKGIISMALYSDFLRIALISTYGGFWIDSTVLVTSNIEKICSNYEFYTKHSDMAELHFGNYLVQGRFAIHLLKADNDNFLVNFLYDALSYYHKKFNAPVDYYLTNMLVDIAYQEFNCVRDLLDNLPINDRGLEARLNQDLNKEFNSVWYEIYEKNMPFQKLSYKNQKFIKKIRDKETFYGYIVKKYLGDMNE